MKKVVFVFPGQGSQYVGMGKDLYERFEYVRELYDKASEIVGFDIKRLVFEGSEDDLKDTANAQPSIFLTSSVMLEVLKREANDKFELIACAGHSLGEYSALYCAGVFSFEDGIKITRKRGELMRDADPEGKGGMAAVIGLDVNKIKKICGELTNNGKYVEPVNYNSPDQTVISGYKDAIKEASEKLKSEGAKRVIELAVSGAFHSKMMEDSAREFKKFLLSFNINSPKFIVFANYNASPYPSKKEDMIEIMEKQMYSPVLWVDIVKNIASLSPDLVIEVGPGQVLKGLIKKIVPNIEVTNFSVDLLDTF
ncbi:MAG: ACP S-malonyltransferase [Brevinematia bacterium]